MSPYGNFVSASHAAKTHITVGGVNLKKKYMYQ